MPGDTLGSYVTNVLHFAGMSGVDSVLWGERVRRMLKFELSC